ncbi:MAG: hypothetical protein HQL01_12185 [Nitrospirae bacterium]|nr:hypothetical protein [Nitrospirota bacterium]
MKGVMAALILLLIFSAYTNAMGAAPTGVREIPYTQDDRDRLIRVEAMIGALDKRMDALDKRMDGLDKRMDALDKRIDGVDKRIDSLKSDMDKRFDQMMTFMLWGFGILFGGMGILMTTVIWDRRTALTPVIRKTRELEERGDKIERTIGELKELNVKYSEIKEVLKRAGLL